jgi:uncharacterized membrane protein (DUF106 family)
MIWTLLPVSLIYGLAAALVFHRFSDQESIGRTIKRMIAHVMEFRLFLDTPALVLRAQRDLLRENFRLLRLVLRPSAILTFLFIILFPQLEAMYGHAPLRVGEPAVVTARLDGDAVLEAPAGIVVETPGVHVIHDRQISWRVRPLGWSSGEVKVRSDGRVLTRQIVAGGGLIYGMNLPFSSPAIEIPYPRRTVLGMNWMIWFFLISTVAAIGYRQ